MNTRCDEWISLQCGDCKWFNCKADFTNEKSTCKRLDHKHLKFAKKIFKCYDCGKTQETICADFEPRADKVWLFKNWAKVKAQIIPYTAKDIIYLNIDGDTSVRYGVRATDFYNNTFIEKDGSLKWVKRYYMKQSRKTVTGYEIVNETR